MTPHQRIQRRRNFLKRHGRGRFREFQWWRASDTGSLTRAEKRERLRQAENHTNRRRSLRGAAQVIARKIRETGSATKALDWFFANSDSQRIEA